MASLVLSLLLLSMVGHSSASWCVCKGLSDAVLQKTLDYACGNGADCNPTHPKATCFSPDNVRSHCNYAVNSFFQKKGQTPTACDFSGTATVTTTDPSYSGCTFPTSASGSGGSSGSSGSSGSTGGTTGTPSTSGPKSSSSTTTLPGGNSPYTGNPTNGVFGSNSTGTGINPDYTTESNAFSLKNSSKLFVCFLLIASSGFCSFLKL